MKTIFTKLSLLALFCLASANMLAQTYNGGTWYSLFDESEHSAYTTTGVNNDITICSHDLFTPSTGVLTFNTRMTKFVATNPGAYTILVGGQSVDLPSKQTSYVTKSTTINTQESHLDFKLKYDAYNSARNVYIDDVKLPLAQHILLNEGQDSKSFGDVAIEGQSMPQTITLRSFLSAADITVRSSDNAFRFNSANNLSDIVYSVGANACASANGQSGAQAGGGNLGDINQYAFSIYFCPSEAKTYNATITITDGTSTATIAVSGTGVKKTQQINWAADFTADEVSVPVGKVLTDIATATSGNPVVYASSDETVLAVEGNTLKALKAGEVTLTASQDGDEMWNSVSATKTIKVTEKQIQYIHWTDNLTRLKVGDAPVVLTATATILVNAETDEIIDAPERTALITYESADNNVVTVSGNELTIVGEGETTLTAILPGDDTYEATTLSMPVRVRTISTAACETYVLEALEENSYYAAGGGSYEPAGWSAPAGVLTFEARSGNSTRVGPIVIQQYVDGSWVKVDEANPGTDWRSYYYVLDRNASKIRFKTDAGSFRRYFKNVLVTQATYLETTTPSITVEKSIIGDEINQTIAIQHSNLSAGVMIDYTNDQIQLSDSELGSGCGVFGEKRITLTVRPAAVGTIEDVITIHDEATGLALNIPVTIHTQRNAQTIVWNDSIDTLHATDLVTLTATAETPVYYTSSDSAVAYVNEANLLVIQAVGAVVITAHAEESNAYDAAELSKQVTILSAIPVISELPTVAPLAYGTQLTNDLLVGGAANVEGVFVWNVDVAQEIVPGEHNLPVQFMPENTALYAPVDTSVVVTVMKGQQTIAWTDDLSHVTVGDTIFLSASANTEIVYEASDIEIVEIEDNRAIFLKAGVVTIHAEAVEDDYYLSTTLSMEATVYPAEVEELVSQYPTASAITYGQALSESSLEGGSATVEGEFAWVDGTLMLSAGTYLMKACFIPAEQDLYAVVEFEVLVVVNPAEQEISWELEVPVVVYLGDTVELKAQATSGLEVTYTLDNEYVASINGNKLIALYLGDVTVTANQDGEDEDGFRNFLPAKPVSYIFTVIELDIETSLSNLSATSTKAYKQIHNGQMVIVCGEHVYNVLGGMIK